MFGVEVRTVSVSGSASRHSAYTVKNDFTPPTVEITTTRNSIRLIADDGLSGVEHIVCEHGDMLGSEVLCPMRSSGVHHYDVYDVAGNITPTDVDFTYRPGGGEWVPGGDPREPDADVGTDTQLPEISLIPPEEVPPTVNIPVVAEPDILLPESDTPFYGGRDHGDTDGDGTSFREEDGTVHIFGWRLTAQQFACLSLLLLLIVLLLLWIALKHDHDRNNKKQEQ